MRKYGVDDKPRFSIKYPLGNIQRWGTCDPNDDDRAYVIEHENTPYLLCCPKGKTPYLRKFLDGALISNGYYDHEHGEWMTPEEFIKQDGGN